MPTFCVAVLLMTLVHQLRTLKKGKFVRFYAVVMPTFYVAVLLMTLVHQLRMLKKGKFVRFYAVVMPPFCVAVLLMTLVHQLRMLKKGKFVRFYAARAVNFQIDLRGGQWKTIWFTSGGQFERFLSSVFVGCSKVTGKIILDPTHILEFGEWHAISFLCMHVHTKRYWKVLSCVVAINFVQNAQWRNWK